MNKKRDLRQKLFVLAVLLFGIIGIFGVSVLISAQTNPLQDELDRLTAELNNAGYDWLVEHSGGIR